MQGKICRLCNKNPVFGKSDYCESCLSHLRVMELQKSKESVEDLISIEKFRRISNGN